jgi:hypothetical protein
VNNNSSSSGGSSNGSGGSSSSSSSNSGSSNNKVERQLFLFSDLLVYVKEKKGGTYTINEILPVSHLCIKDLSDIEPLDIRNTFEISLPLLPFLSSYFSTTTITTAIPTPSLPPQTIATKRYFFCTQELSEKRSWINDISKAINDAKTKGLFHLLLSCHLVLSFSFVAYQLIAGYCYRRCRNRELENSTKSSDI